jgi:hypothetical protein
MSTAILATNEHEFTRMESTDLAADARRYTQMEMLYRGERYSR